MNGSALMAPPQVNLDEFEQRLRMAGSPVGPQEDPLEELARLVGLEADERDAAGEPTAPGRGVETLRLPQVHQLRVEAAELEPRERDAPDAAESERAFEQALSGPRDQDLSVSRFAPQDNRPQAGGGHDGLRVAMEAGEIRTPPRRGRGRALTLGLLVTVGAAGLAGVWALKGAPGLPRTAAVIMAPEGPAKIKPPSQDDVATADDTAVLLKDQGGKANQAVLVSHQEQPNDLQQQGRPLPTDSSAAPLADVAPPGAGAPRALATIGAVGATPAPPAAPSPFPEPKRVKTVSVRPDGSLISADAVADAGPVPGPAEPASAVPNANLPANPPAPVPRPQGNGAAAMPATPKLDLPTKLSPKSTARVAIPKTDTTVAGSPTGSPESPLPAAPTASEKPAKAAHAAAPTQVAANDPAAPAAPASGAWAVQLAAPPSEKEAQSVSAKLQAKYATELAGLQPTIHEADSNGKQIYRVRVSGMSKAEAAGLCEKLKAGGGACFVARE